MKIVFTGAGSGGHFFPIIAVAEAVNTITREKKLLPPKLYYTGPKPLDPRALYEQSVKYKPSSAGKMRRYFSVLNFLDWFKTFFGIIRTTLQLYFIYPDVVFSKGGYGSFPTTVAAKLLNIPLVIHESDAHPGRANIWAGKFAERIAISYPETANFFDKEKVALTGNPIRRDLLVAGETGGKSFFALDDGVPTILVLGGSQGATAINDTIISALPKLLTRYQVIHQTGKNNFAEVDRTSKLVLRDVEMRHRYKPYPFLSVLEMRMAGGAASIIVSRAGSGSIFEIAAWGVPSILIPIPESISHDQRANAFSYARGGGAVVVEEKNLTPNLIASEIDRIMENPALSESMREGAKKFARIDAAHKIAEALVGIALSHEVEN